MEPTLEFVYLATAEVACDPGDEEEVARQIAAIPGVRRVTVANVSVLSAEPVEAGA